MSTIEKGPEAYIRIFTEALFIEKKKPWQRTNIYRQEKTENESSTSIHETWTNLTSTLSKKSDSLKNMEDNSIYIKTQNLQN